MTSTLGGTPLDLLGQVARILNSGLPPDDTLGTVAGAIQQGLQLASVCVWRRDASANRCSGIAVPPRLALAANLDQLPPVDDLTTRTPLVHAGLRLGVLELGRRPGAPTLMPSVVDVLANLLAPFLDAMTLAEDLALEVASRSREITEQRRFTGLVIDSLPVGLYVIDRAYRIQFWNRKRETGTQGLRRDDVVGRPVFQVLTRQPPEQLKSEFDRVFSTGESVQVETVVEQGGERRVYLMSRLPMRLEGDAITHVITIGEDVTEARNVQEQVIRHEKMAAVGQLVAGVMHEINNPLATIAACAAAVDARLGTQAEPAVKEYLEIIDKEVQRSTKIVDGLLEFSRPHPSPGRPKADVDVNKVIERTLFLLKHHRRFKRLQVETDLGPPVAVRANDEQLIQVLMALMLNAVDAMPDGGVLTLRSKRVTGRHEAIIEVKDTGSGIPKAHMSKIFEPFYTTKPPGQGTGLGLSIAYGIMQDHGGRIDVESEVGRGSVFRVVMPELEAT
ncbi:MAG: PAS domain-containing protein [Gemmatimonadetes bacterium]|nr:PAS domain-containing protein [Gemmatimonadota bacterium]